MELKRPAGGALAAQRRYAQWLLWGTRLGLGLLVASFVAYVLGLAPHVPIDQLPGLWKLPAGELLARTNVDAGWGWATLLPRSDMLVMASIAILATCSVPCLLAIVPVFAGRGEKALWIVCLLEVVVLLVAASGLLAAGH